MSPIRSWSPDTVSDIRCRVVDCVVCSDDRSDSPRESMLSLEDLSDVLIVLVSSVSDCTVLVPSVFDEASSVLRTPEIVPLARPRTSFTSPMRAIVRVSRASSSEFLGLKAESISAPTDGSVTRPGWTLRSTVGTTKSFASSTTRNVAVESSCGGARMLAHWTWVVPSGALLSTPFVAPVPEDASAGASAAAVTTVAGSMPGSAADATTVRGAPTRAVAVCALPATSYVICCGWTVRFCTLRLIVSRPE